MPANECIPFKEPGASLTGKCVGAVKGKRFVALQSTRTGGGGSGAAGSLVVGAGLSEDVENVYRIRQCNALGEVAIGVAKHDQVDKGEVGFYGVGTGIVLPIRAGEALNAGDEVITDAEGNAVGMPVKEIAGGASKSSAVITSEGAGAEEKLRAVAVNTGAGGNAISITVVNDGTKEKALTIATAGKAITVTLATDGAAKATSTYAEVIAAINADATAKLLVLMDNGTTGKTTGAAVQKVAAKTFLVGGHGTQGKPLGITMADVASGGDAEIKLY